MVELEVNGLPAVDSSCNLDDTNEVWKSALLGKLGSLPVTQRT